MQALAQYCTEAAAQSLNLICLAEVHPALNGGRMDTSLFASNQADATFAFSSVTYPWTHRTIPRVLPSARCLLSSSSLTSSLLNPGDHNCVLRDTRRCLKHDAWNCHLPTPLSTRERSNLESCLPFLRVATAHVADWNQGLMAWTGTTFSTELREPRAVTMASSV